ncbi:hypothetical protein D3C77_317090 [compost metagenome]
MLVHLIAAAFPGHPVEQGDAVNLPIGLPIHVELPGGVEVAGRQVLGIDHLAFVPDLAWVQLHGHINVAVAQLQSGITAGALPGQRGAETVFCMQGTPRLEHADAEVDVVAVGLAVVDEFLDAALVAGATVRVLGTTAHFIAVLAIDVLHGPQTVAPALIQAEHQLIAVRRLQVVQAFIVWRCVPGAVAVVNQREAIEVTVFEATVLRTVQGVGEHGTAVITVGASLQHRSTVAKRVQGHRQPRRQIVAADEVVAIHAQAWSNGQASPIHLVLGEQVVAGVAGAC